VARIAGVNIPTNKRVVVALQYIHGIGEHRAQEIMEKVGIPAPRRVSQLTDQEVLQIREMIDRDYIVEGDLRREVAMPAAPSRPPRAWPAHSHQRPNPQGTGQADCRKEEVIGRCRRHAGQRN